MVTTGSFAVVSRGSSWRRPAAGCMLLALILVLAWPAPARATTLERMSIEQLSQRATMVVEGTVVSTAGRTATEGARGVTDDDDLPGVAIPASPFTGSLSRDTDQRDVFCIALTAGQNLTASIAEPLGGIFSLFLYAPGTTSIEPGVTPVLASAGSVGWSVHQFEYTATQSGTYYLTVDAISGFGDYTVTYSSSAPTDDDIPGGAIPASPFTGSASSIDDENDVFRIALTAGQTLTASITGPDGGRFWLDLYAPGTTSVKIFGGYAATSYFNNQNSFTYTPTQSGTYYLNVVAYLGTGDYTVTYSGGSSPPPTPTPTPTATPTPTPPPSPPTPGTDDDIPGVAIPASPFTGSVVSGSDLSDDVFRIALTAGQTLTASITGPVGIISDFRLYLYKPGTTSVKSADTPFEAESGNTPYPCSFTYTATQSGDYYLDVYALRGAGDYTVTYSGASSPPPTPTPTPTATPTPTPTPTATPTPTPTATPTATLNLSGLRSGAMRLGRSVTAKGAVTPTSLAGSKVKLTVQKRGARWVTLKSVTRTISLTGAYSWKYKPARRGAYRMRATIAKTALHTAATTKWGPFKVK